MSNYKNHSQLVALLAALCVAGLTTSCRGNKIEYFETSLADAIVFHVAGTDGSDTGDALTSAPASRGAMVTTENFANHYKEFGFKAYKHSNCDLLTTSTMALSTEDKTESEYYAKCYRTEDDSEWPSEDGGFMPLSFFCWAGSSSFTPNTVTWTPGDYQATIVMNEYQVPTKAEDQKDCLLAFTNFVTAQMDGDEMLADAYIHFSHALTAVTFELGNNVTDGIYINSIDLVGVVGTGTATAVRTIGKNDSGKGKSNVSNNTANASEEFFSKTGNSITWTPKTTDNTRKFTATYGTGTDGFKVQGNQATYSGNSLTTHGACIDTSTDKTHTFMFVPQTIVADQVTITIHYTFNGVSHTKSAKIAPYTWEHGKIYKYAINLTEQEFVLTLYVQDWAEGFDYGPLEGYNW